MTTMDDRSDLPSLWQGQYADMKDRVLVAVDARTVFWHGVLDDAGRPKSIRLVDRAAW